VRDLHLRDLLECQPETGLIRMHDQRVVIQSVAALGLLRKELIDTFGVTVARRLLMRFGYADGYEDAVSLRTGPERMDTMELFESGPMVHTLEGVVQATLKIVEFDPERGHVEASVEWHHSYEGEQHVHLCGKSDTPVCWTLVGYASGYASACFGREVYFREVDCIGQGAGHCTVIGKDADAWGDEAGAFREDFAGVNPGEEMERLRRAVQAREQQLARRERAVHRREREMDMLRARIARDAARHRFIAHSRAMNSVLEQAARVAPLDMTVLIGGESGTGKEFIVRMIHDQSGRSSGPLVSVNCAALTETLLESELFGHVRGAFTGAVREKPGLFETAARGTLFLDEVGEMSVSLQAKLLRALEEGEIRRVGGERTIKVNPRVVAASNRDLRAEVAAGRFREDLYFRIGAFVIVVPPLRDRREAIPALAHEFVHRAAGRFGKDVRSISPQTMAHLVAYRWPGNVRELEHAIERAVILADDVVLQPAHLPAEIMSGDDRVATADGDLNVHDHERILIQQAVARFPRSRQRAAEALHMSKVTLWRRMKAYGLTFAGEASSHAAGVMTARPEMSPALRRRYTSLI
jgi:DNA-binding NtrC family response regulator